MSSPHPRPAKRPSSAPRKKKRRTPTPTPAPIVKKSVIAKLLGGIGNLFKKQTGTGQTQTGVVKFFSRSKGFGFIQDTNGSEIFVHISGLKSEIRMHDKVTFTTAQGKRGLTAVNVTVI